MRNEEVETLWVEAWDELLTLAQGRHDFTCMLPDGSLLAVEEGLAWLQDSVYAGHRVTVSATWLFGRPGALLGRADPPPGS